MYYENFSYIETWALVSITTETKDRVFYMIGNSCESSLAGIGTARTVLAYFLLLLAAFYFITIQLLS